MRRGGGERDFLLLVVGKSAFFCSSIDNIVVFVLDVAIEL